MQCSMGFLEQPNGEEWKVDYHDTRVMAKVEKHCVGNDCNEVFAVHTCRDKCEPAPLKVSCEVKRDVLVTCEPRPVAAD